MNEPSFTQLHAIILSYNCQKLFPYSPVRHCIHGVQLIKLQEYTITG